MKFHSIEVVRGSTLLTTKHEINLELTSDKTLTMKLLIVPDTDSATVKVLLIDAR